jgi:hypothetical protein
LRIDGEERRRQQKAKIGHFMEKLLVRGSDKGWITGIGGTIEKKTQMI